MLWRPSPQPCFHFKYVGQPPGTYLSIQRCISLSNVPCKRLWTRLFVICVLLVQYNPFPFVGCHYNLAQLSYLLRCDKKLFQIDFILIPFYSHFIGTWFNFSLFYSVSVVLPIHHIALGLVSLVLGDVQCMAMSWDMVTWSYNSNLRYYAMWNSMVYHDIFYFYKM